MMRLQASFQSGSSAGDSSNEISICMVLLSLFSSSIYLSDHEETRRFFSASVRNANTLGFSVDSHFK